MSSSTLRRRLYHGDVDGRRNEQMDASSADGLDEPLLGSYGDRSKVIPLFQIRKSFANPHQLFYHLQIAPDYFPDLQIPPRTLQMISKTIVFSKDVF